MLDKILNVADASRFADKLVLTSDNPRTEDPQRIIDDVQVGINLDSQLIVESDRSIAIEIAICNAERGDVVLIAGKGHEDYQIFGTEKVYFDDKEKAEESMRLKLEI